ncbi:Rrf2 family transcriptional regulator [Thermosulfurimonas sp. F29]|uniref:RrF2 family transcriptional regulator n=1 Tax=Thermosulfurimonas sp. F29 TaxID=2867247 RepID=UPI001C83A6E8|nr:Rrf2 family transcriptional regulator [Thermosulfurimonas sp. F29]MBX6422613.1 Rrf2 family transcriptional regulator [Thermosulfurimonas sp. F29]
MRLSTRSRYATRILLELAKHYPRGPLQLKEIARRQELSPKYVEQILLRLKKAGLVQGERGARGGYRLGRPPEEISLFDILSATGERSLTPCTEDPPRCYRFPYCEAKEVWRNLNQLLIRRLKDLSLSEILEKGGSHVYGKIHR